MRVLPFMAAAANGKTNYLYRGKFPRTSSGRASAPQKLRHFTFYVFNLLFLVSIFTTFAQIGLQCREMLEDLHKNFERLVALYETSREENISLKSQLETATADCKTLRERIVELERQIDNLRLAQVFSSPEGGNGEARLRVDRLIREIDKCISLLEK